MAGCLAALLLSLTPLTVRAATPAASVIDNQAQLTFAGQGGPVSLTSNRVSLRVQAIVDVAVELVTPDREVTAGADDQTLTFRVRNLGNTAQAFDLSLDDPAGDDFDPTGCFTLVDWNLDGVPEQAVDPVSLDTPVLQPGQSVDIWVSCDIPSHAQAGRSGHIRLAASPSGMRSLTDGQLASAGPNGVAVVFGRNLRLHGLLLGTMSEAGVYRVRAATAARQPQAQLIKTQSVRDAAGGSRAMPGAVITYRLEARFEAGMSARKVRITDLIPAGSAYVPGSLTLDGAPLTDADDGDAGRFAAGGIDVGLGDVAASRTVTFQVRINPLGSAS